MCTINILKEEGLYRADDGRGQAGNVPVCKGCTGNSGSVEKLCLCGYPGTERGTGKAGLQGSSRQGADQVFQGEVLWNGWGIGV